MDLKIEITKLYGLCEASKMLDHAVRQISAQARDWRPFSPSRFVYSYFTLNSIYGFDWVPSVKQEKAVHWEPDEAGSYPKEFEQLRSLISFITGALSDQAPQLFSQYLYDQLEVLGVSDPEKVLLHIDSSNETKRVRGLRKAFPANFSQLARTKQAKEVFVSSLTGVLAFVQAVRNNIFHGSKTRIEMLNPDQQTRLLIYTSIVNAFNSLFFDAILAAGVNWRRVPVDLSPIDNEVVNNAAS